MHFHSEGVRAREREREDDGVKSIANSARINYAKSCRMLN